MESLVLSGGGSHGGWQVGALQYLFNDLSKEYTSFAGVSVGAINAAFLAQYPVGNQKQGYQDLYNLWAGLTDKKIKKNWFPLGPVHALWLDSLYCSEALWSLVRTGISLDKIRSSGNQVSVSAVDINSAVYTTFTQNDDNFIDGVLASCSYPMGLQPIVIGSQKFTDGGVYHTTPINEAINMGATDMDIIICGPIRTTAVFDDVDTITYGLRCLSILQDNMQIMDLKMLDLYNQMVVANIATNKRFINYKIVRPTTDLIGSSLTFDRSVISPLLVQGYADAKVIYK